MTAPAPPPRTRLQRRMALLGRLLAWTFAFLFLLLLGAGIVLTRTPWGQDRLLREILGRVEGRIEGRVEVRGVSSPGLLHGITLHGIRIEGEDGRPFLEADSLVAGLSLPALLRREVILTRVQLWRPRITLERLGEEEPMNVVRIFAPPPGAEAREPAPPGVEARSDWRFSLRRARLHEGSLDIFLPFREGEEGASPTLTAVGPGGQTLSHLRFREVDLRLADALLAAPGLEGELYRIEFLSLEGQVWQAPFHIRELRGELLREEDGLRADIRELRLPGSVFRGTLDMGWGDPAGFWLALEGEAGELDLEDLWWLEERLPRGRVRGPVAVEMDGPRLALRFRDTELHLDPGRVRAGGTLVLLPEPGFGNLRLDLEGVHLSLLDPWLPEPLPLRGALRGEVALRGTLDTLRVEGRLGLTDPATRAEAVAVFSGGLLLGDDPGVLGLQATLAPFDYGILAGLSPGTTLKGPGSLRLEATGTLREELRFQGEATHVPWDLPPSRVTLEGALRRDSGDLHLEVEGELRPLSLTALRESFPALPATGELTGPFSVRGDLSHLTVEAQLATVAGPLRLAGRFDARDPGARYELDGEAESFLLSALLPSLPGPTRLSGRLRVTGRGLHPDSLEGEATLLLRRSRFRTLDVDTLALALRAAAGLLHLDTLVSVTSLGSLEAGGSLGLGAGSPPGELRLAVESESLAALQPFLLGDSIIAVDTLSPLEREILALGGVKLDTLPTSEAVAVEGAARGVAVLRGNLQDFSGEGTLSFQRVRYRADYVESGTLSLSGKGMPGAEGRVRALLRTDSLRVGELSFRGGEAEVDAGWRDGRVKLLLDRSPGESYLARGTFRLEEEGAGRVDLEELALRFDEARWTLGGPASFTWSEEGVRVHEFELLRPGPGLMRIHAHGFLPVRGEADFDLEVRNLSLERVARLAQLREPLEGLVDLTVRVEGPAQDPVISGSLGGYGLRVERFSLDTLSSAFRYSGERLSGEVRAWAAGREILEAKGGLPADLRFLEVETRLPEGPVDLILAVDSFPAALALAFLEDLERVEGDLSGEVRVGGTPRKLVPVGEIRLSGGAAVLPFLGVRYYDMVALMVLEPEGVVVVDAHLRSRGAAHLTGTLTLDPITDPLLDLRVEARDFLAVDRRDVQARLGGRVELRDRYSRPRVGGSLTVEQAVLMVEEFARTAEVVDLSDPAFFNVVDTTLISLRPVLEASQNPFLQNLQMNVSVGLARDTWLRGRDLNVEMGGSLLVTFDRTTRDLALVGELQAIRGVYNVLGRQFQVREGVVSFLGTPGLNPNLNIQAAHRLRTLDNERLEIVATVGGTLLSPRVTLTSDAPFPIAESDLVSYLIFGRPTYALASGQSSVVQGAAGSLLGVATGAGASMLMGTVANELGSVFSRGIGLDYLAISQGQDVDPLGTRDLAGTVATTRVELGQYVTEDVFLIFMLRPLTGLGAASQSQFAGVRLEWRLADLWTMEGFIEDRFSRNPLLRFGEPGYRLDRVTGLFLYREWGY